MPTNTVSQLSMIYQRFLACPKATSGASTTRTARKMKLEVRHVLLHHAFGPALTLTAVNLLTPSVVKAASREISTGDRIQLDWELHNVQFPGFNRKEFHQNKVNFADFSEFCAMDDEVYINTQAGSQWDSLKHFAHQASKKYYNGLTHEEAVTTNTNGTHNWCEKGGIVGRGVLCDWLRWYEEKNGKTAPSAVSRHEIPVEELKETLKWQSTTLRQGDILVIRSGYVRWHK